MLRKRCFGRGFVLFGSLILSGSLAHSTVLYSSLVSILSTDPTQLGRLSRNGVIADWSFQEPFPGTINPTTAYHYEAIAVLIPAFLDFVQITIDSNNVNIFASAYNTSYTPNSGLPNNGLDINYMGDEGASGNFFGTDPRFFQVIDSTPPVNGFRTMIIVLNETVTNGGLNSPVGVLVEGFINSGFDELPEPMTSTLVGGGLLALAMVYRRRRRAAVKP